MVRAILNIRYYWISTHFWSSTDFHLTLDIAFGDDASPLVSTNATLLKIKHFADRHCLRLCAIFGIWPPYTGTVKITGRSPSHLPDSSVTKRHPKLRLKISFHLSKSIKPDRQMRQRYIRSRTKASKSVKAFSKARLPYAATRIAGYFVYLRPDMYFSPTGGGEKIAHSIQNGMDANDCDYLYSLNHTKEPLTELSGKCDGDLPVIFTVPVYGSLTNETKFLSEVSGDVSSFKSEVLTLVGLPDCNFSRIRRPNSSADFRSPTDASNAESAGRYAPPALSAKISRPMPLFV